MTQIRNVVVAAVSFAVAAFIGTHVAHAQIYRGMNRDAAVPAQPQQANTALGLGVRPQDVGNPGPAVLIQPNSPPPPAGGTPQGTSVVFNNPCSLPAFSRPAGGNWNGTAGGNVRVFQMNPANLPATLQVQAAPLVGPPPNPDHAVISTVAPGLTLANMQAAIAGTAAQWAIVPPPAAMCP